MTNSIEELPVRKHSPKNNGSSKRRTALFVIFGVLAIAAVVVGLALGLSNRNQNDDFSISLKLAEPFMGDIVTFDEAEIEDDGLLLYSTTDGDRNGTGDEEEWWEICGYDPAQQNNHSPNPVGDISYQTLVNRNPDCGAYTGTYEATIEDFQQDIVHRGNFIVTVDDSTNKCILESNNIPNHDIGGNTTTNRDFGSTVDANGKPYRLEIPREPSPPGRNAVPTYVERRGGFLTLNGILLNGVDLDMDSAFCYHEDFPGPVKVALFSREDRNLRCGRGREWYAVPNANPDIVTLDEYSGHSFNGRYHYHGDNTALHHNDHDHHHSSEGNVVDAVRRTGCSGSPVVGFAPDGFPIYGHYVFGIESEDGNDAVQNLRKAKSSYRIKESFRLEGVRDIGGNEPAPPIDEYHPLGMFENDWEYVEGLGDLDECNGLVDYYGNYGYYYTEGYPYGPRCTMGIPDPSFTKPSSDYEREDGSSGGTGGNGRPGGGGNGRPGGGGNGRPGGGGNGRPGVGGRGPPGRD